MKPYPKKADTPSRKARKGSRTSVFVHNKTAVKVARAKARRERRAA